MRFLRTTLLAIALVALSIPASAQIFWGDPVPTCTFAAGAAQLSIAGSSTRTCGAMTHGGIAKITDATAAADCLDIPNAAGSGTASLFLQWDASAGGGGEWTCPGHADGADCASGSAPLGVDATGAVVGCFDVETAAEATAHAASATVHHTATVDTNANTICAGSESLRGDGTCSVPSGGGGALNDLTDATITTPATGATLIKSGTDWVDGQLDLADTDAVTGVLPDANVAATLSRDSELTTHTAVSASHHAATVDTNADTICTGLQSLRGDGTCADPSAGGSITGWPTQEGFNTTGRPTQALFVGQLGVKIWSNGPRDIDGSVWDGTCAAGPNATTDFTCVDNATTAALLLSLASGDATFSNVITPTLTDAAFANYCRDSVTFVHESGTANDVPIYSTFGLSQSAVLRDDATDGADVYRVANIDFGANINACLNLTQGTGTRQGHWYATTTADDLMARYSNGSKLSPYGARVLAQDALGAAWEDQYPETLGSVNLMNNGYMETDCTAASDFTLSAGTVADTSNAGWNTGIPSTNPLIGLGCKWTTTVAGTDTFTFDNVPATVGAYYVGQVYVSINDLAVTRSLRLRIQNQGATAIAGVKWWVDGPGPGRLEAIDDIDPSALVGNELHLINKGCFGGCLVRYAFRLPVGDTAFALRVEETLTTSETVQIDESWVREKLYQDLHRHPLIMDGRASITLITDETTSGESIEDAFDYMLGYTTPFELTARPSIRPDLYLSNKPSSGLINLDGVLLSGRVGAWDSNLDLEGNANASRLRDQITGTHYCIGMAGNFDAISLNASGAGSRPSSATLAADSDANRYLYYLDQVRGFEQAAESMGCIPVFVLPQPRQASTAQTYCATTNGTAEECSEWWMELAKHLLHSGI